MTGKAIGLRSRGRITLVELEGNGLELAVPLEVGLEVLQQNYFLIDRCWIVKEIVVLELLSRDARCLYTFDVTEME